MEYLFEEGYFMHSSLTPSDGKYWGTVIVEHPNNSITVYPVQLEKDVPELTKVKVILQFEED